MRRIMLLTTLAAMLAASMALSGVAQALTPEEKCQKLAVQTLGSSFDPANYTFIAGTPGDDSFDNGTAGTAEVFCGFGGNDSQFLLGEGDIFLGGAGDEHIVVNEGTVYGDRGNDYVSDNYGTVYGGAGSDSLDYNRGTFYGGGGDDQVFINYGTFNGGAGFDRVHIFDSGTLLYVEQVN
jgi:hypothetical protein